MTMHIRTRLAPKAHHASTYADNKAGRIDSLWPDRLLPFCVPEPTVEELKSLIEYHGGMTRAARIMKEAGNPVDRTTLHNITTGRFKTSKKLLLAVSMLRYLKAQESSKVRPELRHIAKTGKPLDVRSRVLHLGSPGQASRFLEHLDVKVTSGTLRKWALSGRLARYHRTHLVNVLAGLTYLCEKLGPQSKIVHTKHLSVTKPLISNEKPNESKPYMEKQHDDYMRQRAMMNLASGRREEELQYPLSKANYERLSKDPLWLKLEPYAFPYPHDPEEISKIVQHCGGPRTVSIKLHELYGHYARPETIRALSKKTSAMPTWKTLAYLRLMFAEHPNGIKKLPTARAVTINTGKEDKFYWKE